MNQSILTVGLLLSAFAIWFVGGLCKGETTIRKKTYARKNLFFRCLSALLFLVYLPCLISLEAVSEQIGLSGGANTPTITALTGILKWFTYFTLAALMVEPFFKKQSLTDFTAFFAPVILLLNAIFLKPVATSIVGYTDYFDWRVVTYSICLALAFGIAGARLIEKIRQTDFSKIGVRIGKAGLWMLVYLPAFMPVYLPQLFFGIIGEETVDFTLTHRLLIYIGFAFPALAYIAFRKKSKDERLLFLILLSLSGFMQYFCYTAHRDPLTNLPLHLCNTAIVLMLFAYVFRLKSVFYFTYLVNVLGAFCAILLPNTSDVLTEAGVLGFWYNHTYAFALPILGVALGIFERPNIKLMYGAIAAFSVYVLSAAVLNGWLNNSPLNVNGEEVDYFFLYSDFFIDKFAWAVPLKYNSSFVWKFQIGDTMMTFYWLYNLVIWLAFIALMFAIWGIYGLLYRTSDAHKELAKRKVLMQVDHAQLLKELGGRSVKEPLHPEGASMIKIINFSKTYAGTDKKAVKNLNLEIHEGEVFGFIGHNGAGKSTTIKSLVGIQSITEGSIEVQGYDIARQPLQAKLNMGYVSDNHAVYENLTGREYISYVADLYMVSEKDKNERIQKYAKMFGLEKALDNEIKSYSHGMKQKTMVIGALIHNPKVWVLDEPLTGLDPTSSWQIKECMRQHADAGNIVFFSSHVIEVVEKVCDRIAIIADGTLQRVDRVEDIKKEGLSLEQLYLQYAQHPEAKLPSVSDEIASAQENV